MESELGIFQPFENRVHAGRQLGRALQKYRTEPNLLVLGIPRGGIPVAAQVAISLNAPLDILLVRKLGVPGQEEVAFGAIASGHICVINQAVFQQLPSAAETFEKVEAKEARELARRTQIYCGDHPAPDLEDRCVIVVDDGIATGATMKAALQAVRQAGARQVVVAAPTAPATIFDELQGLADDMVILTTPVPFNAVSQVYRNFSQTTDAQVREILEKA